MKDRTGNIRTGSTERQPITAMIADEAGRWDARLRAPDCNEAERTRFAAWRDADPAHRAAFERLQTIVASFRYERGRADVRALRDEALRAMSTHGRRRFWLMTVAAGLVAFGVGAALWKTAAGDWVRAPMSELAARLGGTEIYKTGLGERSTFVLPDGSSVELNAQSRIEVSFNEARRNVDLVKGQALFSVAKNAQRAFVVRAGDRQIVAVGTQFDVRLDARSVQVTLIEGKVRVEQSGSGEAGAGEPLTSVLKSNEIELTPGKQLVASRANASPSVRDIDVAKVTGWREGRIFLEDLSLDVAVEEMNKHSAVQVRLGQPALSRLRVNGMFKAGEQDAFVAALEEYFPSISVQYRGGDEIVLAER